MHFPTKKKTKQNSRSIKFSLGTNKALFTSYFWSKDATEIHHSCYSSTQNQVSDPFFHAGLILANEMKILFLPISYSVILLSLEIMMEKEDQKGLSSG